MRVSKERLAELNKLVQTRAITAKQAFEEIKQVRVGNLAYRAKPNREYDIKHPLEIALELKKFYQGDQNFYQWYIDSLQEPYRTAVIEGLRDAF